MPAVAAACMSLPRPVVKARAWPLGPVDRKVCPPGGEVLLSEPMARVTAS